MRFGLFGGASAKATHAATDSNQSLESYVDYVCEAERLGYHSVFLVEHHFMGTGQVSSSLSLLAYLAARTSRIRLGTGVVVLPWHNPVLIAEQIATIDQLSHGRVDFGIGKGYRPNEFAGFCMTPEEAAARYSECVAFLRRAWSTSERFSHKGEFWRFENIVVDPPPFQQPHPPFWVGAASNESIERAGRDGVNLLLDQIATADAVGQRVARYRASVEAAGREYVPLSIGLTRALQMVHTEAEWRAAHEMRAKLLAMLKSVAGDSSSSFMSPKAEPKPVSYSDSALTIDEAALIGYPHEIVERLNLLRDQGVEYVLLADTSGSMQTLRDFAETVMPKFA